MFQEYHNTKPQIHFLPAFDMRETTEWYGVKGLWFEGAKYQGKRTKVFGLIGYPKLEKKEKAPAIVLVYGGGGQPYAEWIRIWNEKGYIALAISTTGYFPKEEFRGTVGTEIAGDGEKFIHGLYGELQEDGYTVGPDNNEMQDCSLPLDEQWMYHAVANTILAHNILRNDSAVDCNKIGISGISWGGVVTSLAIGYDNRYAFAIPVYGSGCLDYLPAPSLPQIFRNEEVKRYWNAADKFANVTFPVFWFCFCEDTGFTFGANSLSYLATKEKGACLSIKRGMGHSHVDAWIQEESYRFADKVLQGEIPFAICLEEPKGVGKISFSMHVPADYDSVTIKLHYITESPHYDEKNKLLNEWTSVDCQINSGVVKCVVPEEAYGYFIEFKGTVAEDTYISTSSWVKTMIGVK